jgi:uncharacterized protein
MFWTHITKRTIVAFAWIAVGVSLSSADAETREGGKLRLDTIAGAKFDFGGVLGERVKANVENWLLLAPEKNPELCEVFAHREANHEPPLVPWVGEFAGKYLISVVQAMRMSDDTRLRDTAAKVVARIIELQGDDGYLGPWPREEQLRRHWDLWENYHVMLGLLVWSEQTGDEKALAAARKAADLLCTTFLDGDRRVLECGSPEMNMGVIHVLAMLYRKTGEPRYLELTKAILRDFEQAGDYYRQGLQGEEFFRTPKPRWESLHSLQGLAELYRITGDETFRRAFLHHWASIRRFDVHNTGGFSSGEQATGNPFADKPIETCCVIAWQAVMIDALRLTGDSTIADDLELATLNAVAGAQHASGKWFTYNTPMNGRRMPSHEDIAFQARPGGMFLNCCSVNGPRGLGMLSEWAVMRGESDNGLTLNFYGPLRAEVTLADGTPVAIEEQTDYPLSDTVKIKVRSSAEKNIAIALRIPAWSPQTAVSVNGKNLPSPKPGHYLTPIRVWLPDDEITLKFNFGLRYESGDLEQAGKISVYRGPLLLAADERLVGKEFPPIDAAKLGAAQPASLDAAVLEAAAPRPPWLAIDLPTAGGKALRLIDFASAGATGKEYRSWLSASNARPPRPACLLPANGAAIRRDPITFTWRRQAAEFGDCRYTVAISDTPSFERVLVSQEGASGDSLTITAEEMAKLKVKVTYFWKIIARNEFGESESVQPFKRFAIEGD